MKDPLVSIITPVFKAPVNLLERFIESALRQSLSNLELIAVDDASPDMCPQVLDNWALKDTRMSVIHRPVNGRAGMARNDGLELAKGKYVFFADADDVIQPDMCKRLSDIASHEKADIVFFSYASADENGSLIDVRRLSNRNFVVSDTKQFWACIKQLNFALWNKLFRRKVIKDLRFEQFDANIGEDTLFNIAALCSSQRLITSSYVGYRYTVHSNSATGRSVKGMAYLETLIRSQIRIKETLLEKGDDFWTWKCADWVAIKRFATGCEWIAEHPDQRQRNTLWQFWRNYLTTILIPSLDNYQMIGSVFRTITTLFNPTVSAKLTRLTIAALNR